MDGWIDDDITPLPFALQQGTGCSLSRQELGSLCLCHWNSLLFICSADTLSGENYTAGGAGGWGSAAGSRVQPVRRGPCRNAGVLTQLPPQTFGRRYRRARQYLCYRDTPERHLHTHTHQGHRHRYSQPICCLRNISGPFWKALSEARLKALLSQDKRVCFFPVAALRP